MKSFCGERQRSETCTLDEDRGSAIAEFVLIALPLLLPATLFFVAMNQSANVSMSGSLMARQAVSAFTSGASDSHGHSRVQILLREYEREDPRITELSYQVSCQKSPCITPGASVLLSLTIGVKVSGLDDPRSYRKTFQAIGFVDKWGDTN